MCNYYVSQNVGKVCTPLMVKRSKRKQGLYVEIDVTLLKVDILIK